MPLRQHLFVTLTLLGMSFCLWGGQCAPASLEDLRQWASHKEWTKDLSDEELRKLAETRFDCYVVVHTHWDKEWAFSFEQHRIRLIKLLDNTLAMLEEHPDFRCFVLDGQSSLVSDYLEMRPEMRERLENLVRSDRLLVGPWYTQMDLLVSSGEEIVRNLLVGIRTARDVGKEMRFGYTADNFGLCAQLPQIYRGFGIERAAMYRGPATSGPKCKTIFDWRALDGSSVKAANLTGPSGYLMFTWPFDVPELAEQYLLQSLHFLIPHAVTNKILLPAGTDATEPHPSMLSALKRLSDEFPGLTFQIASHNEYMDAALADHPELPVHEGILRYQSRSCVGSISARLNQKRFNAQAYTNLEQFAEPLSTLAWLIGGRRYPGTSIEHAWKYLFENLTHDNMAGFCMDPVHEVMDSRYYEANRLAETLAIRGMKTLVENIRTPDKSDLLRKPVVVFNTLPWERTDVVETLFSVDPRGRLNDPFQEGGYKSFQVVDLQGEKVPAMVTFEGRPHYRVQFIAGNVPGFGYKTYQLIAVKEDPMVHQPSLGESEIENEFLRLAFRDDGRFDLFDKDTGVSYPGLHSFEDITAKGSSLHFSLEGSPRTTIGQPATIEKVESGEVSKTIRVSWSEWEVPTNRVEGEWVLLPITSYITLHTGVKRVDIYTEVENTAYSHLLRAVFPVPVSVESFAMGTQFGAQVVPVYDKQNPPTDSWSHEIYPHLDWCDVSDGVRGLAVLDRGTPTVSVYPGEEGSTQIALSLLRSNYSNGGDVRPSIPGHRFSSEADNIGAQLLGTQRIRYSLFPHAGSWEEAKVYEEGQNLACRLWPETLTLNDPAKWQIGPYGFEPHYEFPLGNMPPERSFLRIEPQGVLLSAFKKAESGEAIVVRFYNTTPSTTNLRLSLFLPVTNVSIVNLMEEEIEGAPEVRWSQNEEGGTNVELPLNGFEIVTLRMEVDAPEEGHWLQTSY